MKLHSIAIAAALLAAASSASFAAPAVAIDNAATVRIYMAGATALRNTIAGVVLNDICGGTSSNNTTTLYNMTENGSSYAFAGNFWAITCKVTAAGGAKIGVPSGTSVAFFKSDAGGSAQGVFPVYFGTQRPFVEPSDLSKCTTTTADRLYTACPATRLATPMLGMSDVEPALFKGPNVPNDALEAPHGALVERRHGSRMAEHALRRHHHQRLAPGAEDLLPQRMIVLRGRGQVHDLHVVFGG